MIVTREYTHALHQGYQTNIHKDLNEKLIFQISGNFFSSNHSLGVLIRKCLFTGRITAFYSIFEFIFLIFDTE